MWTDLKNLREPLRIGDVVILPGRFKWWHRLTTVTGFSPGVGNFGAEDVWRECSDGVVFRSLTLDHQAMVEHRFKGSWKAKEE